MPALELQQKPCGRNGVKKCIEKNLHGHAISRCENLEWPLGLLEHVIIKSCGIEFEHTFAIVDFGQDPSYEVILGRLFIRQLMVLKDRGYDYLYLRHEDVTTRVKTSRIIHLEMSLERQWKNLNWPHWILHHAPAQILQVSKMLGFVKRQVKI